MLIRTIKIKPGVSIGKKGIVFTMSYKVIITTDLYVESGGYSHNSNFFGGSTAYTRGKTKSPIEYAVTMETRQGADDLVKFINSCPPDKPICFSNMSIKAGHIAIVRIEEG